MNDKFVEEKDNKSCIEINNYGLKDKNDLSAKELIDAINIYNNKIVEKKDKEIQSLTESNNKFEMENIRLNKIIKTFEGYLDTVLYTYRKNDLSEACIQLKLAKYKLKDLKDSDKE